MLQKLNTRTQTYANPMPSNKFQKFSAHTHRLQKIPSSTVTIITLYRPAVKATPETPLLLLNSRTGDSH